MGNLKYLILILSSSLVLSGFAKLGDKWICTGEQSLLTTTDCETLGPNGIGKGCYHVEHFEQYQPCNTICNRIDVGSTSEDKCNAFCRGYLGETCSIKTAAELNPTTIMEIITSPTTISTTHNTLPSSTLQPPSPGISAEVAGAIAACVVIIIVLIIIAVCACVCMGHCNVLPQCLKPRKDSDDSSDATPLNELPDTEAQQTEDRATSETTVSHPSPNIGPSSPTQVDDARQDDPREHGRRLLLDASSELPDTEAQQTEDRATHSEDDVDHPAPLAVDTLNFPPHPPPAEESGDDVDNPAPLAVDTLTFPPHPSPAEESGAASPSGRACTNDYFQNASNDENDRS